VAQFWGAPVAFGLMGLSVITVSAAVGLPRPLQSEVR
jgi:hypothetical protein